MRAQWTGAGKRGWLFVGLVVGVVSAAGCGVIGLQESAARVVAPPPAAPAISVAIPASDVTEVERSSAPHGADGSSASCRGANGSAGRAPAYGWPVKPFHRQHPVRGYFGDPRVGPDPDGTIHRTFHFGVDVSAPDGTAVYATVSGVVAANALHPDVVRILTGGGVELSYWHIAPTVRPGQHVTAYRTLIGRIEPGWGHVHLSEMRGGTYVNPLRPGAMGPYMDRTCPVVKQIRFERAGVETRTRAVRGVVDLVVSAFDPPALSAPAPWNDLPVTPALLRWRVVAESGRVVLRWQVAHDVRRSLPGRSYDAVYASRTRQNRPHRAGNYRFYLVRGWNSSVLGEGGYAIHVELEDTRGNVSRSTRAFTIVG